MSHFNQNRNFQNSHYQNQSKANQSGEHPRTADLSNLASNLPSLRTKCEQLLQREMTSLEEKNSRNNTNGNQLQSRAVPTSDVKALSLMTAKNIAQKNSINEMRANLMKPLPYRGGIGSETLTKEVRDAQTNNDAEKKRKDILKSAGAMTITSQDGEQQKAGNSGNTSTIAERIDAEGKDSSEKKILSRMLPRAIVRGEQFKMLHQQSGQIRQREEEENDHDGRDAAASSATAVNKINSVNSALATMTVKGGGSVAVSGKKLAVDPRMALMNVKKKKGEHFTR